MTILKAVSFTLPVRSFTKWINYWDTSGRNKLGEVLVRDNYKILAVDCCCLSMQKWISLGTKTKQLVIPFSIIWHRSCVSEHMMGAAIWMLMFTWAEGMSVVVHRRQILWSVLHTKITLLTREVWHTLLEAGNSLQITLYDYPATNFLFGICCCLFSQAGYWSISWQAEEDQFRFKPTLAQPWSVNSRVEVLVGAQNGYLVVKWHRCRTEPVERRGTYDTEKSKTELNRGLEMRLWTSPESHIDQNNFKFPDCSCIIKQLGNSQQNAHHFPCVVPDPRMQPPVDICDLKWEWPVLWAWVKTPWMTIAFVHSSMEQNIGFFHIVASNCLHTTILQKTIL